MIVGTTKVEKLTIRKRGGPESRLHRLLRDGWCSRPSTTAVPGCHAIPTGSATGPTHPCGSYCSGIRPDFPMPSWDTGISLSSTESDRPKSMRDSSTRSGSHAIASTAPQAAPRRPACHRTCRSLLVLRCIEAPRTRPLSP